MNVPAITSLAVLKVNWDHNKDYLDTFVPLIAECIRSSHDAYISLTTIQQALHTSFSIHVPQSSLKIILNRMKRQNYLKQENNVYLPNHDNLAKLANQFLNTQSRTLSMYEEFLNEFSSFCQHEFGVMLKEQDAENAIIAYLNENEFWVITKADATKIIQSQNNSMPNSSDIFVASFVKHLYETDDPLFHSWETIATGHMLSNFVFLPDPSNTGRRFKNTSVYLDTSLIIYVLGYAGQPRQGPIAELIKLLHDTGAEIRCFNHTLEESRGILDACASRLRSGKIADAYGPSIEYFIEQEFTASDIDLFSARLERDIQNLGIRLEEKPNYSSDKFPFVIDEMQLESKLKVMINYNNRLALQRDVASISAISRLRRGKQTAVLEECGFLFVTMNHNLAYIANTISEDPNYPNAVGVCVTDYALTNALWLKKPITAPDLPRKRIIADYYAALQPSRELMEKYYAEIEKLQRDEKITESDYYLLRYSLEAKYALLRVTYGDTSAISEMTIAETLKYIRDRMTAERDKQLRDETLRRTEIEQEANSLKAEEIERDKRLHERSASYAARIMKIVNILVIILLLFTTATTFPWPFFQVSYPWYQYAIVVLQIILFLTAIINALFGTPINYYLNHLQKFIEDKRYCYLKSLTS